MSFRSRVEGFEKSLIVDYMVTYKWHYEQVIRNLEIPRATLYAKLKKYGIKKPCKCLEEKVIKDFLEGLPRGR